MEARMPAKTSGRPTSVRKRARSSKASSPQPANLQRLAAQVPAELLQQLATAIQSGHWLFAVWNVSNGRIHLERTAADFPTIDLDQAVAMLAESLRELRGEV